MEFNQLCVWPGTTMGDESVETFEKFFKDEFNVVVKFAEEVITNPDKKNGKIVPDTGGRHDILFWIADEYINKFAISRFRIGIRWWEDVVKYNNESYLYTKEILKKYPVRW